MLTIKKINNQDFISIENFDPEFCHSLDCDGKYNESCKVCKIIIDSFDKFHNYHLIPFYKNMTNIEKRFYNNYLFKDHITCYKVSFNNKKEIDNTYKSIEEDINDIKIRENISEVLYIKRGGGDLVTDIQIESNYPVNKVMFNDIDLSLQRNKKNNREGAIILYCYLRFVKKFPKEVINNIDDSIDFIYNVKDFTLRSPLPIIRLVYSYTILKIFSKKNAKLKISYIYYHLSTNIYTRLNNMGLIPTYIKTDDGIVYAINSKNMVRI